MRIARARARVWWRAVRRPASATSRRTVTTFTHVWRGERRIADSQDPRDNRRTPNPERAISIVFVNLFLAALSARPRGNFRK